MITMDPPTIIRAQIRDKQKIKAVLKLSFSSDPLVRWVFPDPNMYLKFFDIWMEEFSKISFSENIVFAEDNFYGASLWHPAKFKFDESCLYPTLDWMTTQRIELVSKFFDEFSREKLFFFACSLIILKEVSPIDLLGTLTILSKAKSSLF